MNKIIVSLLATTFATYTYAATTTATSVAPTSGATISAPVTAVAPAAKKVTLSYIAENSVDMAPANRGETGDNLESQQHVGIKYDLGNNRTIQFRQYFHYNMTDATKTDEWAMGDHVFQFVQAKAATVGAAEVSAIARLYLPGTEYTREVGKYELRLTPMATQQITGKLKTEYVLGTRFYAYSGDESGQRGLRVLPAVELQYQANKVFSPFVAAFTDNSWYHTGSGIALYGSRAGTLGNAPDNTNIFYTDIGTEIALAEKVALKVYVETGANLRSNKNYDPREEDNNAYNLELSASL
jgi:isopentenyldiphosphate isomerase